MAKTTSCFRIFWTNRILAFAFISLLVVIWYNVLSTDSPFFTKILAKTVNKKLLYDVKRIQIQDEAQQFVPVQIQMAAFKIPNRNEFIVAEDEFHKYRTCKIPYIFPYEEDTLRLLKRGVENIKNPHCLENPSEKFLSDQNTKIFWKNPNDDFWKENSCCYVPFAGINQNYKNLTECIDIIEDVTTIPNVFENIQVVCFHTETRNLTYRDYFHFLRLNATVEKVLDEKRKKSDDYHPSVIILGLDSVSFTNFHRFLPKTRKYILESLEAIEFSEMNKVGRATTHNVIPMMSNCGYNDSVGTIFPGPDQDCTPIWERYEEKGYRTLQSVEEYWVVVNQKMKRNGTGRHNMTYSNLDFAQGIQRTARPALKEFGCFEHKWAFDIISDRLLQAARKLRGKPYFHFLWSSLESHQIIAMAQLLDNPLLRVLKSLVTENLLEDTILFLLSDHGMIPAYYAQTKDGKVEASQPFLYVVLPKRIKRKYTVAVSNMKRNSKGLVTQYDIHQTLLSILNLSSVTNRELKSTSVTNRKQKSVSGSKQVSSSESEQTGNGISLFHPVPLNRTCDDAHIPKQYCLCWYWKELDFQKNRTVLDGANFTVGYINQNLEAYPDCLPLTLKSVDGAEHASDAFGNFFLRISFSTTPNEAKFQVIVTFNTSEPGRDSTFQLVGDVERKNKYGNQSSCLTEEMQLVGWIRSVCLCKQFSFDYYLYQFG